MITEEMIIAELDKSSNAQLIFTREVKTIPYTPEKKAKESVLEENKEYWLRGNTITFPLKYDWDKEDTFKTSIPEDWRKDKLIPLHNNDSGLTSIMVSTDPYKSIPGLYYVKLKDIIKFGKFIVIPKTFKFDEVLVAVEENEDKIINKIFDSISDVVCNGYLYEKEYFRLHEDDWYMIMEDVLKEDSNVNPEKIDMSDETFNRVQDLGLGLLRKALEKHNIDKEVINTILGDSGVIMMTIK